MTYTAMENQVDRTFQCKKIDGSPRKVTIKAFGSVLKVKNISIIIFTIFGPHRHLFCRLHRRATQVYQALMIILSR